MAVTVVVIFLLCFFSTGRGNNQAHHEESYSTTPTRGQPWPMPQKYSVTTKTYDIDSNNFQFTASGQTCDILTKAFARYKTIIFGSQDTKLRFYPNRFNRVEEGVTGLNVKVQKPCEEYPYLGMDESYELMVPDSSGQATLSSVSVWGALRGLETFSQLITGTPGSGYKINGTTISDSPRFQHRGLLFDTSRHFLGTDVLKKNLDAMAQSKFNVFHWHIVDDQSFPYVSQAFPQMSQMGAYDQLHLYSPNDVKEIIDYARDRGIRVIPEFDTPGHSQSWGKGITDLLTKCYSKGTPTGTFGPIDPTVDSTFQFLNEFFTEIKNVFPDKYVHLGGDEVSFSCWQSNPNITEFMKQQKFGTNYAKLEEYYMQKLIDIMNGLDKGYLIWQEVIDNGGKVKADTVVEVWKGGWQAEMGKVTGLGYQSVLSTCWYLNYISYGSNWNNYYLCEPYNFNGTEAQKKLVIGGEACMWGEYVDDTNVISRTWPRASVVAERLWSAQSVNDAKAAAPRLEEHRCRMVRRGFQAESINGPGYCTPEY
ncbi:hypothetical protein FSP39_002689 [Pinctada imbricata]|uniref:Beta-hexosaminidase n=1 Tax=Pinctada imbricata TaxID=66713 RepID=A0AA88Y2R5_PINIB|nr:hypothetical protein FSP39_002689 [Pinctada imbricata]